MNAFLNQFNIFRKSKKVEAEPSVESEDKPKERPLTLDDYIGQESIKEQIRLKVNIAKNNETAFCHTLLLGHAGAGKTTLANIIAQEMNAPIYEYMGSDLNNIVFLYRVLDFMPENSILFIDEIHLLCKASQEFLYSVLEDCKLSTSDGTGKRLNKFTIIGCTTHAGLLNHPFMERFAWKPTLAPYNKSEMSELIKKLAARKYKLNLNDDIALSLAGLCQATPRKAVHLIQNFIEVASCLNNTKGSYDESILTMDALTQTCKSLDIDPVLGLDRPFRDYLNILQSEQGKPIGLKTLSTMCKQQDITVSNTIEPFLMLPNTEVPFNENNILTGPLVKVTRGGRVATQSASAYLRACKFLQENHGWFPGETFVVN